MNKWEIEVQRSLLNSEKAAVDELAKQYKRALQDIGQKVKQFQMDIDLLDAAISQDGLDEATKAMLKSQKQSKIYQQQYQKALKSQVSGILDKMQGDNYSTIDKYLKECYETGYIGTMYDIAKQGIPIIAPINQAAAVKAILTDSKIVQGFYNRLGVDTAKLKKTITQEISRGIASGLSYSDIARNINNASSSGLYNAQRITRTEGHRIQQTSTRDAQEAAKAKGADVVKQWDAALDARTRPSHARVDGEIRELDEKFSNGLRFPGDPHGSAAEVVNCRCTCDTRARWALDDEELQTLKDRAEYFGLDKTDNFEDFKRKYLNATEEMTKASSIADVKDFSELDKYMKLTYNVSVDSSIQNLDFATVQDALTGVESVFSEFPGLAQTVETLKTSQSGVMSCSGGTITFNPTYFQTPGKLLDDCERMSARHWWVKNASPASIGAHESAHAIEWMMIQQSSAYEYQWQIIDAWNKCTEAKKIISQACKNVKKSAYGKGKINAELISSISKYAQETPSETMAEAFADVYANGENANPLSLEIKRLTIEILKSYKGGTA